MTEYNGFLVRDSLSDDGTVPSPGYPYHSPDMINYQQIADPETFFKSNYNSDPNIAYESGEFNYIYVRGKNLGTTATTGEMMCYWTKTSLVMVPSQWSNQMLSTAGGSSKVNFGSTAPGSIAVGDHPFVWRPPSDSKYGYCMVGRVVTPTRPNPIPSSFSGWDDFVTWVRSNQDICWRNLTILNKYTDPQWDQLSLFENIEDTTVPIMFTATADETIPVGTIIGLKCAPLNIKKFQTITSDASTRTLTASSLCPANFVGNMETLGTVPSGSSWPEGSSILTQAFVGRTPESPVAKHATDWSFFQMEAKDVEGLSDDGVLVEIGNVTVQF